MPCRFPGTVRRDATRRHKNQPEIPGSAVRHPRCSIARTRSSSLARCRGPRQSKGERSGARGREGGGGGGGGGPRQRKTGGGGGGGGGPPGGRKVGGGAGAPASQTM